MWSIFGQDRVEGTVASLRYRAKGWDLRYRDKEGVQRTERFIGGTPRRAPVEAQERRAEVEAQMFRGTYVTREDRGAIPRDLPALVGDAPYQRDAAAHRRNMSSLIGANGRSARSARRTSTIWIAKLSGTLGPYSVRACYGLLRGPLRRAARDRTITDPCIDIHLPKLPDITKTFDDVLSAEEVDRLVDGLRDLKAKYQGLRTNGRYQALWDPAGVGRPGLRWRSSYGRFPGRVPSNTPPTDNPCRVINDVTLGRVTAAERVRVAKHAPRLQDLSEPDDVEAPANFDHEAMCHTSYEPGVCRPQRWRRGR
jgi:hypothetical protein